MTEYVDIPFAAKAVGMHEGHVRRLCGGGRIAGAKRQGGKWLIPVTWDSRLRGVTWPEQTLEKVDAIPPRKRDQAMRRAGLVRDCEAFCAAAVREGGRWSAAERHWCDEHGVAHRSMQRWRQRFREAGLTGLADGRHGRPGELAETIDPEAWDWFRAHWLSQRRPEITVVHRMMAYINETERRGWIVPSYGTMTRLVRERIPLPVQVLYREGVAAYEARCAPYIMTDPESIEPGSVWIGDHHQLNLWVQHRGRWVRPWITTWMDMRSRVVMGHHLSAAPNQGTILLAMRRGVREYGPPDAVKIDNGKDYDSETFTGTTKARRRALGRGYLDQPLLVGLYGHLGVGVSFAIAYHPQSKAVERLFDTIDRQLCKQCETYCGKDTHRKPEGLVEYLKTDRAKAEAYTLESFRPVLERYIAAYHATPHRGRGMEGATPLEVMAQRRSRRAVSEDTLEFLLGVWSQELTVGKNGVRFRGMYYGQYDTRLLMHQGRRVRVSYDPDDVSRVRVHDATSYELLAVAEQAELVQYGRTVDDESLREGMRAKARAKRALRESVPAARRAHARVTDLAIEAQAAAGREGPDADWAANLRPVATRVDGQLKIARRIERTRAALQAAGAEGLTRIGQIEIDLDAAYAANHPGLGRPMLELRLPGDEDHERRRE